MRSIILILISLLIFSCAENPNTEETESEGTILNEDHSWSQEQVLTFLVKCRLNSEEDGYDSADEHCACFFNYISSQYPVGIEFEEITVGNLRDGRAACFEQ